MSERFDKDAFISAYSDAANTQAAVIAGAFAGVHDEIREMRVEVGNDIAELDRRLDRIEQLIIDRNGRGG